MNAAGGEKRRRFSLGKVHATPTALERLSREEITNALCRHAQGDWGEVDAHDRRANERALQDGSRLFSVYRASHGSKFWVITEADRSLTTVLLPEDY
jgi:hypothetical protein